MNTNLTIIKRNRRIPVPADATTSTVRTIQVGLVCLLAGVLAFAVMAFGAAEYWAMCVLQVSSAALLVLWAIWQAAAGRIRIVWNALFVPLFLLILLVAIQLWWPRTEYWYGTWVRALQWGCYGIVFFVSTQILTGSKLVKGFGLFLCAFGFFIALLAIAQGGTSADKLYWLFRNESGAPLYGPYPNHAHYAGLMEMMFPIPLLYGCSRLYRSNLRLLLLFAALVMAGSIFLAASFGGILSFLGEMVVLLMLLLTMRQSRHRLLLSALSILLLLSVFVVILQPATLQERVGRLRGNVAQEQVTGRLRIVQDSIPMIRQRPFFGYGLGSFVEVFPGFRTFSTNYTINAAHNDYVQAMVEVGLVGFGLILALIFLLYREGVRTSHEWQHRYESCTAMAALIGCSGMLIHSLCDFNLQIPANAALFSVLAALAVTNAPSSSREAPIPESDLEIR